MPTLMQQFLTDCRDVVAEHKVTPMAEAYAEEQGASAFQDLKRIVRDLGVKKTLVMLSEVCAEASQLESDAYEVAAIAIDDCAAECDLEYDAQDDDETAETVRLDNLGRAEEMNRG